MPSGAVGGPGEGVWEISCNLDDMTPEEIGFALEILLEKGALDVFTTPIGMKKSRPGTMLTVLCREADRENLTAALFRHTTTLGVRSHFCQRQVLTRRERLIESAQGPVRVKCASGFGVSREKAEYEDLARIARETGKSLQEVRERMK